MILILGLGSYTYGSGSAAALFFARRGEEVVVTDLKTADALHQPTLKALRRFSNVTFVLGKHRKSDIKKASLIVRNPGVPDNEYIQYAQHLKKPITNDIGIFIEELRSRFVKAQVPIVAVTGTRGKSTTTALIHHILHSAYGKRIYLGGNIGVSPLHFLQKIKAGDIVVLELSSWLLRDLHAPSFTVAVITNVLRDHLDYYGTMNLYKQDKQRIFLGQTPEDFAVVNGADKAVRAMAKHTKAAVIYFQPKKITGSQLLGEHNHYNIGAAWEVAQLFGVSKTQCMLAIQNFTGISNRLELVHQLKGRSFYNDTTATTPDATIAALRSFRKKIILIAGGNSKRLPLTTLMKEIPKRVKTLILLSGNANHHFPAGINVDTMQQAVTIAWQVSKPGDIILLSPGVTWLPVMNEFERGKQFVQHVKQLR